MVYTVNGNRHASRLHLGLAKCRASSATRLLAVLLAIALADCATAHDLLVVSPGSKASGNADAFYSSIADAMNALQPGDHLVISAGVYRESLLFPTRDWGSAKETVIEGNGEVVINGADIVKGWTSVSNEVFAVQLAHEPAQVAIDASLLRQIGGTVFDGYPLNASSVWNPLHGDLGGIWPGRIDGDDRNLPMNSFYYDRDAHRLYVRIDKPEIAQHSVEVSSRTYSAYGASLANVTLRNLSFRFGNTSISSRAGLVTLAGKHIVLDHIAVSEADSVGVELDGDDNTMTQVVANRCGQLGIKARGSRVSIASSETSYNNTRRFNKWWEAGGAKFIGNGGLQNSVVSEHTALGNIGDGIWFDWENRGNRVEYSDVQYNSGMGIHYEASATATIVDNVVVGNGQRGIYLPHSSGSVVAYNLVAGNGLQGIAIIDEGRADPDGTFDLRPKSNRVLANVVAWNGGELTLPRERADNIADDNVYIEPTDAGAFELGWRSPMFASLSAWVKATAQDAHSIFIKRSIDASFKRSVSKKEAKADLAWYRALRPTFAPVRQGSSAAGIATGSGTRDGLPGPAI